MNDSPDRVVITGLGAISPLALTVNELWGNLVAGRSGVACITQLEVSRLRCIDYQSPTGALPLRHAHSVSSMKRAGQPSGGVPHVVKFRIAPQNRLALTVLGSFSS